jgi:hypothetical protein
LPTHIIILLKLNASAARNTLIPSPIISLTVIAAETLIFSQMTNYQEADKEFIPQIYENLQR